MIFTKIQKKQMINIINTMFEGIELFQININAEEDMDANLLIDLQDAAIQIGNIIEQSTDSKECLLYIEDYCEQVYILYNELNAANYSVEYINNIIKKCIILLDLIKKNVENADVKREVVFLPYKFSMWDSMESIWKAAYEDKNSNVNVIPIPYFDKDDKGNIKEWHYEGDKYPGNIPIVHYESYDLEYNEPDVIFIHYPYDNHNHITGIHPEHYCKRLRNITSNLVYVPYFISLDDVPEHFCVCAATIYSHFVITQSIKVRDTYIRLFEEFEKENNCCGIFGNPKEKFLALGSPKIDKAIDSVNEEYDIEEFNEYIYSEDGKRKKIILLNTTLLYMLENKEVYIETLRKVFDYFITNKDVALWWRPHPLSDALVDSMQVELKEKYKELVDYYIENKIGIYDNGKDLNMAITMCDACYGDNSSVLALLWAQNKPIMLRNVKKFCSHNKKYYDFNTAFRDDRGGIKKTLLFETRTYALSEYIKDILNDNKYDEITEKIRTINKGTNKEVFLSVGCAGEIIYKNIIGIK